MLISKQKGGNNIQEETVEEYIKNKLLLNIVEDIVIAKRLVERLATDDGNRTTLTEAAVMFEVDTFDTKIP